MGAVVASEEGVAKAPAAAAGEGFGFVCRLGDEVGLVGDQLGVEAEGVAERAFDLAGSVVVVLQTADGLLAINGKEHLKDELKKAFAEHNADLKVMDVFFTDFLVQR